MHAARAIYRAAEAQQWQCLRGIAEALRKKARLEEQALERARQADWLGAIGYTGLAPKGFGFRPSRLGFRWVRGTAGWLRSPIGPQLAEDLVPDDPDAIDDPHDLCGDLLGSPADAAPDEQDGLLPLGEQSAAVSYTHLTLPTKRIV